MALAVTGLPTITIITGSSVGNAIHDIDDALSITIFAPAALSGTVTLEVEPSSSGTSFVTQQSGGSDVTIPAGKATTIVNPSFKQFRLVSNAAEGADRVFSLTRTILV